jgi:hypothetical protein
MVIFNVWCFYLNFIFIFKINSFTCTCCGHVHVLYFAYIAASYILEYASIYRMLSNIYFSLLLMGLRKICEPKTPFKFEHGLHLDHT